MGISDRRVYYVVFSTAAVVTALWGLYLAFGPRAAAQDVSNIGLILAPLSAAYMCVIRGRRHAHPGNRRAWILIGAACGSWSAGQVVWTWYESVQGTDVPFPSFADIGYLGLVPLAVAGLLAFPTIPSRLSSRVRVVLDGLIIATAFLFLSWAAVLGHVIDNAPEGILAQCISVAYPLGDVVILTILFLSTTRKGRSAQAQWSGLLLSAGLLGFAISDSGFAYLTSTGAYSSGDMIDLGWFAGFVLVFLAAARPPDAVEVAVADDEVLERVVVFLPYVPVCVAAGVGAFLIATDHHLGGLLSGAAIVLLVLAVARQVAALLENASLTRYLERRVVERTEQLHVSEQRFRSLVQNSSDVVTVIGADGDVRYQSPSIFGVFGHSCDDEPVTIIDLLHPDDRHAFMMFLATARDSSKAMTSEVRLRHGDGDWSDAEVVVTNLLADPSVAGVVVNTRDISERKELERQLSHQAFHDDLTGLPNRALFRDRVNHALGQVKRRHGMLAVLFLDLDGFKRVNDTLGHGAGDQILIEISRRLETCIRTGETIARLSGDEFGVLLDDVLSESETTAVAERIIDTMREPVVVDGEEVFVSASLGIAMADDTDTTCDDLLRNADLAMYRAKADAEGAYCRYEPEMHSGLVERVELERDMRVALDRDEMHVAYQPIVDVETGAIRGVESLIRWQNRTRGLVPPLDFIPLAESNGMIVEIGRFVLEQACRDGRRWRHAFGSQFTVSVNLSARQLQRADFVAVVERALADGELEPEALVLEITESVLIGHAEETLNALTELRELGVALAIDDFGTGYSSLSYLHRFPVDILKIDRSFVERLTDSAEPGLARSIVGLGRDLGLRTVAEGVEQMSQLKALRDLGCDLAQGYLFGRPGHPAAIDALVGAGPVVVGSVVVAV